jgi:predicted RNase H-like HicB family nuclease
MAKFTAMVEQADDGTWTAAVVGENSVLGTGDTREDAIEDLRRGLTGLIEYLKAKNEPLPQSSIEVISIEVAA